MNRKVRPLIAANGGAVVGEAYHPLDCLDYRETVGRITASGAAVVFNTIVPPGVAPFLEQLHDAGFTKRGGRVVCTYFEENLLDLFPAEHIEGLYGCLDLIEDILDWRPFDHITLTTLLPAPGASKILMSYAFGEGADGGTHFEVCFAKPKPKDLPFYEHVWPNVQQKFTGEFEILRVLLEEQAIAAADVPLSSRAIGF